ncbi:MAG: hypothetical protein Q7U68_06070 [Candidatus Roizmanbacteria bacterium]|nr:hypothetical protein [Candidatus Roizmanbacteria bacterium]
MSVTDKVNEMDVIGKIKEINQTNQINEIDEITSCLCTNVPLTMFRFNPLSQISDINQTLDELFNIVNNVPKDNGNR